VSEVKTKGGEAQNQDTWPLLKELWAYVRPHKASLFVGLLMIPILAATTAYRPLLLKEAIDDKLPAGDIEGARLIAVYFFGLVVVEFVALASQIYFLQRAGHQTIFDLRRSLFSHAMRLPARFFDRHPIGNLLSRTTSDVEGLGETLSFGVFTILTDVFIIASILASMFVLDAKLTALSLALAPILWLIVRFFAGALRKLQLEIRRAQGIQTGHLAEQLAGIGVLQLFGREQAAHDRYADLGRRYLRATKTANIYDALLFALMDGIAAFCIAVMLYIGADKVLGGAGEAMTVGVLSAFVLYLQRIFVPIREFSGKLAIIQRATASLDRIWGLFGEKVEAQESSESGLEGWTGAVKIRDLRFRYRPDTPEVLKGIDLDIGAGEVVAVVGRTGSGKSSLGRVLTRIYDGYEGSIELETSRGAVELETLNPAQIRREMLMVQQDVFLFDADVRFNVSLGEQHLRDDDERLEAALDLVQAGAFVRERGGLSMQVGERGRSLSAGEAQLLAFARVAAREPKMLILDEATASVDSMTEQRVQAAIEGLLRGRSVLVIAHRLSTIRHADKIIVMRDGGIAEMGTHEELLEARGLYAELYESAFSEA
jgi:ATP-binding cassette subfamily B protein